MAKGKTEQTLIYKILHRKLKIEEDELCLYKITFLLFSTFINLDCTWGVLRHFVFLLRSFFNGVGS